MRPDGPSNWNRSLVGEDRVIKKKRTSKRGEARVDGSKESACHAAGSLPFLLQGLPWLRGGSWESPSRVKLRSECFDGAHCPAASSSYYLRIFWDPNLPHTSTHRGFKTRLYRKVELENAIISRLLPNFCNPSRPSHILKLSLVS